MKNYFFSLGDSTSDLGFGLISMADFNCTLMRASRLDYESTPPVSRAKRSAQRDFEHALAFPSDNASIDAEPVPQSIRRVHKIRDDVDALFLDARRGDLGESRRFHEPDFGAQ